jgi:hypothetical protein
MSATTGGGAPKIKKNASRKNKKSWRKNVDMTAVEEYLEEKRFDERIGKIIFSFMSRESYILKTFCYEAFRFAGVSLVVSLLFPAVLQSVLWIRICMFWTYRIRIHHYLYR